MSKFKFGSYSLSPSRLQKLILKAQQNELKAFEKFMRKLPSDTVNVTLELTRNFSFSLEEIKQVKTTVNLYPKVALKLIINDVADIPSLLELASDDTNLTAVQFPTNILTEMETGSLIKLLIANENIQSLSLHQHTPATIFGNILSALENRRDKGTNFIIYMNTENNSDSNPGLYNSENQSLNANMFSAPIRYKTAKMDNLTQRH